MLYYTVLYCITLCYTGLQPGFLERLWAEPSGFLRPRHHFPRGRDQAKTPQKSLGQLGLSPASPTVSDRLSPTCPTVSHSNGSRMPADKLKSGEPSERGPQPVLEEEVSVKDLQPH